MELIQSKNKPCSVTVLEECAELQRKKSRDYQNDASCIKQADYYPGGIATIIDIIWAKVLRARSVTEAMHADPNYKPNFESIEDSFKDMINYASFGVAYIRGGINGQETGRDFLNREVKQETYCETADEAYTPMPKLTDSDIEEFIKNLKDDEKSRTHNGNKDFAFPPHAPSKEYVPEEIDIRYGTPAADDSDDEAPATLEEINEVLDQYFPRTKTGDAALMFAHLANRTSIDTSNITDH